MINVFADNPVKVCVYNPIDKQILSTYTVLGDCPRNVLNAAADPSDPASIKVLRAHYGDRWQQKLGFNSNTTGGDDLDDIEELLGKPTEQPVSKSKQTVVSRMSTLHFAPGTHIVQYPAFYPEDKWREVKDKIYLITGIPTYRQHLYYYAHGRTYTTYKLYANGLRMTDITATDAAQQTILGVPVDREIYDSRSTARVESLEEFQLIGRQLHDYTIYVADLAMYTSRYHTQLIELIRDPFQFELYYYGFVLKYFPHLTTECFIDYIVNESELEHKYPKLAPNRSTLKTMYEHEHVILDRNYKMFPRIDSVPLHIAITQMIATVESKTVKVNIRNLFDVLKCTKCLPAIYAKIEYGGSVYMIHKRNVLSGEIHFPNLSVFSSGLTIAISLRKDDQESFHNRRSKITLTDEHNRYMFLNIQPNGRYFVRSLWSEEDEYGFEQIIEILRMFVDPIIDVINKSGRIVFSEGGQLERPTKHNVVFYSLNVACIWKRAIPENTFKILRTVWDEYAKAGIISVKNNQHLLQENIFRKGMHDFDVSTIDKIFNAIGSTVNNQFAYMSIANVRAKWEQSYDGRVFRMMHRTTDIKFEVINIREGEFKLFYDYLAVYIMSVQGDNRLNVKINPSDLKPLKRLRRGDPDLYNLKKYGSKKVYSVLCQNKHQPIIYSEDELRGMSAAERSKLVKYWNFTFKRPAWYGCPSKAYPHLSFFVGAHPRGYCLPCCKKAAIGEESRKSHITSICLQKHVYTEKSDVSSRHIMAYGKEIDNGRIMKLPESLRALLFNTEAKTMYIWGVEQNVGLYSIGIVHSLADILQMDLRKIYNLLLAVVSEESFIMLLGGQLPQYFANVRDLRQAITEIFAARHAFKYAMFTMWNELFIELAFHIGVFIVTLYDDDGTGTNMHLRMPPYQTVSFPTEMKYAICCSCQKKWYPIYEIEADVYYRNGSVHRRVFTRDHSAITTILTAAQYTMQAKTSMIPDYTAIEQFCASSKWSIDSKLINKRGLCYAVILSKGDKTVYFPIDYSAVDMSKTIRGVWEGKCSFNDTLSIIEEYNSHSKHKLIVNQIIADVGAICGLITNGDLIFIFEPVATDKVREKLPEVTIQHMNNPIHVNKAIMSGNSGNDKREALVGTALYNANIYNLFVIEFVNYLADERNEKVRAEIGEVIGSIDIRKNINTIQDKLRAIVQNQIDWSIMQSLLNKFYYGAINRADLQRIVGETVFDFDRMTINKLRGSEWKDDITRIANEICEYRELDTHGLKFPNIYVPCASNGEQSFCASSKLGHTERAKKKLIVNRPIEQLVELLASDLRDELRLHNIIERAFVNNIIDYFRFERRLNEQITIYRLYDL